MHTIIHCRHYEIDDTLREQIEAHLTDPLRRHFDRASAELLIEITHRPEKRRDQAFECRSVFHVPAYPALCVTEIGNDLRQALDRMHHRLLRLVDRYVEKRLRGTRFPKKYYATRVYEEQLEASEGEEFSPTDFEEAATEIGARRYETAEGAEVSE
jgi:ribosome-associated translation inhibitor RaiA